MKVLLVQPISSTGRGLPAPPFGLMYMTAMVEREGFEVKILDRNIETDTIKEMKKFSPDILGVSCLTGPMILDGLIVTKKAKDLFGNAITTIWGGIHPSLLPEQTLMNRYIDIVVIGEGEHTFLELLTALKEKKKLKDVKGIGYKKNGRIILNEKRPLIKNLDELPELAWNRVKAKKYLRYETPLLTSRGCPHRCAFCYNQKFNERKWRGMSAERVLREIEYLESIHPIKRLKFYDDNLTADRKRFFAIIEGIPLDYPLFIETRVDYINNEFINKIKKFSDPYLFIGVESGSPSMLKKMQKDITIPQIKYAFNLLNKNNINTTASFMIGLPGETMEEVQMTLKLVDKINPTRYTCCIYTPYPGSLFYDEIVKENLVKLPQSLEEWGKFSSLETASINVSKVDAEYLEKIYKNFWYMSIWKFIKRRRYNWLCVGIHNYLNIKYLTLLRYFRP